MTQPNLVKRKISLPDFGQHDSIKSCVSILSDNPAIYTVDYNDTGNFLSIEYNQLVTNYSNLLAILTELNIVYSKGFAFKFRKSWYDYLDENTRENAIVPPPACCNKPPKRTNA